MEENKDFEQSGQSKVLPTIGGEIDETSISLRFFGDKLEPNETTEKLKCQPTDAHKKGEIVPNKFKPRIVRTGSWLLSNDKSSERNLEN